MPDKAKDIFVTGIINDWYVEWIRDSIDLSPEKSINLHISSVGGSINAGFELSNYIEALNTSGKKEIHTWNLSHVDSIATVIFLSAPKEQRHVVENSTMFYHDPRFIIFDEVTEKDAEKMAAELRLQKNRVADYYTKKIDGMDKDEAIQLMDGEVNLTAKKMLELGIVNEIKPAYELAAYKGNINKSLNFNDMSLFKNKSKDPVNQTVINDDLTIIYNGELKEGSEVMAIGSTDPVTGEYEFDNQVVNFDNGVVKSIAEKESTNSNADGNQNLLDTFAQMLVESEQRMTAEFDKKIAELRGSGSNHKPAKTQSQSNNSNAPQSDEEMQKQVRQAINEKRKKQAEDYKKKREAV